MFDFESGFEKVLCIIPKENAEEVWTHAGMQILADLERDFDFFREWRRHVLSQLILRQIETRIGRKISDGGRRTILDLNACSRQGLAECGFCKLCRRWRSEEHTSELQSQSNLVCRL